MRSGDRYEQECQPEFGQTVFCRYTGTLVHRNFWGGLGLFLNSRNLRKDLVSSRVNISGKVLDLVTPWNGVAAGRRR